MKSWANTKSTALYGTKKTDTTIRLYVSLHELVISKQSRKRNVEVPLKRPTNPSDCSKYDTHPANAATAAARRTQSSIQIES